LREPSPVSAEILGGLAARSGDTPLTLAARAAEVLEEEGLTRRFFRDFSRFHALAAERLSDMPRASAADRRDLALVILTRVLFLYFVQARGWLAGRSDFLPSLLDGPLAGRKGVKGLARRARGGSRLTGSGAVSRGQALAIRFTAERC
jgi:hypothetical protein